jgi:HEPN domain-containing protein
MNETDEDQAQILLRLAKDDEFAARAMLPVDGLADSILGFHCQQAVEKALKAALAARGEKVPRTHDLEGLLRLCRNGGIDVPERLEGVQSLAPYGVLMRYGNDRTPALDREQALKWATDAVGWAQERVRDREAPDPWRPRSPHDRADR